MLKILFNHQYLELWPDNNFVPISDCIRARNSDFSKPRFDRDSVKLWKGEQDMVFISAITERSIIEIYFFNQASSTIYQVGPLLSQNILYFQKSSDSYCATCPMGSLSTSSNESSAFNFLQQR